MQYPCALIVRGMQTIPLTPGNKIKETRPSARARARGGHICAARRAHIYADVARTQPGVVLLIHSSVDFNEHDVAKREGGVGAQGGALGVPTIYYLIVEPLFPWIIPSGSQVLPGPARPQYA